MAAAAARPVEPSCRTIEELDHYKLVKSAGLTSKADRYIPARAYTNGILGARERETERLYCYTVVVVNPSQSPKSVEIYFVVHACMLV